MRKKQKKEAVTKAMEFKTLDSGKYIYVISNTCNEDVKNILMDFIYDENIGGVKDLSYEICFKACEAFQDVDIKEIQNNEDYFYNQEYASIWNQKRLEYLNNLNEDEIFTILKDLGTESINTACAIWFDDMVRSVIDKLKEFICS